jgi:twitching motility two-component system response regulator PilG
MQQDNFSTRLLNYHELLLTLQGLCREKQSGVMVISSESGGTAKLMLDHGAIFDVSMQNLTGKAALEQIKKIVHGKVAFLKRTHDNKLPSIELSTAEILQLLSESKPNKQSSINGDDQFAIINAHLAAVIGPVADIICLEYKKDIGQSDNVETVVKKIAQQVLAHQDQAFFIQSTLNFIARCEQQKQILDAFKSTEQELQLHPTTLSLFIRKHAAQSTLSTALLTRLATQIEYVGNLVDIATLTEIMQFLEKTSKTGLLSVTTDVHRKAGLYFDQGTLINAFEEDRRGVAVALDVMTWQPESIRFTTMAHANMTREIHQTVAILQEKVGAGLVNRETGSKIVSDRNHLSSNDIQAALAKEIERLQSLQSKGDDKKIASQNQHALLVIAVQMAESYRLVEAEQHLSQLLLSYDDNYQAWLWLAKVLTSMTAIEFALKKSAHLNSKNNELSEDVKKFTVARKLLKGDFVLRCPFCWMPIKDTHHECPHCLADFFISTVFFNRVGKAKTELLDKAIERYDYALQRQSSCTDCAYLRFYLAMAYLNRKYFQEALDQFNEIVKSAPENKALFRQSVLLSQYMQATGLLTKTVHEIPSDNTTVSKGTILVIEDSLVTRKVIARTLIANGYEVIEAKNVAEAVMAITVKSLDLVLLDIVLPDGNGYDILAKIRQTASIAKMPVIMLTSRDSLFDKLKGKVSDADEYLTKPFQPDELLQVVKKYLK